MRRRVVVGLAVPLLLVTAACSGSDDSAPAKVGTLASVTVSDGGAKGPELSFKAPIRFEKTANKVVTAGPGTGPAIDPSSLVTVHYVGFNATDEQRFTPVWNAGPSTFYVNSVVKSFSDGLIGKHAGDRVLIVANAKDAFGATGNLEASVRPNDSVIFLVDVDAVAPTEAHPAGVPSLQYDPTGNPSKFTADDSTTKDPTDLGIYPIIEGTGPIVKTGDHISVEYFGQIYPDKAIFNPWNGQPFDVTLGATGAGGVIKGWDQGLTGQRVGTRLVLVVPPAFGYGDKAQGTSIPANSTLVFAIEILSVS